LTQETLLVCMPVSFNIHMLTFFTLHLHCDWLSSSPCKFLCAVEVTVFVAGSDYNPGSHSFMR